MRFLTSAIILLILALPLRAGEFRHFGHYLLKSHFKITGDAKQPIPIKPLVFHVATDGVSVKITVGDDPESTTTFRIYRSDGIGRQRAGRGAIEVVPGIQAMTQAGGILRHLRLSADSLTITTFPGVSDQTVVSHAVAAENTGPVASQDPISSATP